MPHLPNPSSGRVPAALPAELRDLQARILRDLFRWCLVALTPLCVVFAAAYITTQSSASLVLASTFVVLQVKVIATWWMLDRIGPMAAQRLFLVFASVVVALYLLLAPTSIMLVGMMGIFFFIRVTTAFEHARVASYGLAWLVLFAGAVGLRTALGITPIDLGATELFVVVGLPIAVMVLFAQVDHDVSKALEGALARSQDHRSRLLEANEVLTQQRSDLADLARRQTQMNVELGRTNEELRSISFTLSHDLRAPLVNARGFALELRRELDQLLAACRVEHSNTPADEAVVDGLDAEMRASLNFIDVSLQRMDTLIAGILRLSRIGQRELTFERVDLNEVVGAALATLHHAIRTRGVTVDASPLPVVYTDLLSVTQIVSNLLANAVAYLSPERPGLIRIAGVTDSDLLTIGIEDNGRGIPAGMQAAVFEPFTRLSPRTEAGEGMGLSYVQVLLHRLGGRAWCESVAGVGSTFYFTLPASSCAGVQTVPRTDPAFAPIPVASR